MEYLDIVDQTGRPIGKTVSREQAHKDGILHRTTHVWIVRKVDGRAEVLLQKRSMEKDSFPGLYDTSSAGHIPAGEEPLPSALRELSEELGITATPEQLVHTGSFRVRYEKEFHGRMFRDNEVVQVYVYTQSVDVDALTIQTSEVDEARWFDLEEVWEEVQTDRHRFCVPMGGLKIVREYVKSIANRDFSDCSNQVLLN